MFTSGFITGLFSLFSLIIGFILSEWSFERASEVIIEEDNEDNTVNIDLLSKIAFSSFDDSMNIQLDHPKVYLFGLLFFLFGIALFIFSITL